tara:strand:- start:779 stop:1297 length:519 start_codon:yes stop_codon:yes gene_type:complete
MNIEYKKITEVDLNELINISKSTYIDTFSWGNSIENMSSYINFAFNSERLTNELNEVLSEFYFFYYEDKIAGYIKINFGNAQTEIKENNAMELERIYVLKSFQGKNIGKKVLEKVIAIAHQRNMEYLWLGVWEKNEKAIRFYEKNNFKIFSSHEFKMGDEIQTDFLMKLNLK